MHGVSGTLSPSSEVIDLASEEASDDGDMDYRPTDDL
jgi:hypothetical protein